MNDPDIFRLRRRQEALTEKLDQQVEQVSERCWTVPSRSDPTDFHLVIQLRDGTFICDCEGARAGQPCRHVEATRLVMERDLPPSRIEVTCNFCARPAAITVPMRGERSPTLHTQTLCKFHAVRAGLFHTIAPGSPHRPAGGKVVLT